MPNIGPRVPLGIGGAAAVACGALAYPALVRVVTWETDDPPKIPSPKTPA